MPANINLSGTLNPVGLAVPGAYVNVLAPPAGPIPGAPSNIVGVVGTGTWGPVNSSVQGGQQQMIAAFGAQQARRYDLNTAVAAAAVQGANVFVGVRVTDGTDVAASVVVPTAALTLTAKYTGTLGNSLKAVVAPGTANGSWKVTLSLPGYLPETFDNLVGSGNALWVAMAAAINGGQSTSRGPSVLAVATAGAGTTAPTAGTYAFAGGTDGATTITSSVLIGADGANRSGMYGLRGSGAAVALLADCGDSTTWSTQLSFALSEQLQMVDCGPAGQTIAAFATAMGTAAIDSPWFKAMVGDWVYVSDTINNVVRLISPCAFYAGRKAANGPQQSALNKQLLGIVGTQKSFANQTYSFSDLQSLAAARGDVIGNPSPGGAFFSCLMGANTSSNPVENDDSYCTLTNFLALSLAGPQGGGQFVGQLATPTEQREAQSAIAGLLQNMADANPALIGNSSGTIAYSVTISTNMNGVQTATTMVAYLTVIRFFVVNLTGGATVQIAANQSSAQTLASLAA